MERGVIAGQGPDSGQKAHDSGPTYRPFCPILKCCPNSVTVVGLGMVDGPNGEPDDKYNDDGDVPNSPNFVQPANEPGRLHGDDAIDEEQQQKDEVGMPCFGFIIRIGDHAACDQHRGQRVVDRTRSRHEAAEV